MKKLFFLALISGFWLTSRCQQAKVDSLLSLLPQTRDTGRVNLLNHLTKALWYYQLDKAFIYNDSALSLAKKLPFPIGEAEAIRCRGVLLNFRGDTTAITYLLMALDKFRQMKEKRGIAATLNNLGAIYNKKKYYDLSLSSLFESLDLFTQLNDKEAIGAVTNQIGNLYVLKFDYTNAIDYFLRALAIRREIGDLPGTAFTLNRIGDMYFELRQWPQALNYYKQAFAMGKTAGRNQNIMSAARSIGNVYLQQGNYPLAKEYFNISIKAEEDYFGKDSSFISYHFLGQVYAAEKKYDSAVIFFSKALEFAEPRGQRDAAAIMSDLGAVLILQGRKKEAEKLLVRSQELARQFGLTKIISESSLALSGLYAEQKDYKKAFEYFALYSSARDSLKNENLNQQLASMQHTLVMRNKQTEIDLLTKDRQLQQSEIDRQHQQRYVLIAGVLILLGGTIALVRANRRKQEINKLLSQNADRIREQHSQLSEAYGQVSRQKDQLSTQRDHLEKTLEELRATQAQLIQSEKMASLGELTAGIAHEIQNPLNFVNNFSEVSLELAAELKAELDKIEDPSAKAALSDIVNNLASNQQKINHHGKRADAIVKGMLQHSRTATANKEPTDINAMTEEFLRLSYHGFRSRENLTALIETHFDSGIGKMELIPQDIGRVLLNLFNNAFYSLAEKKKLKGESFQPVIQVTTERKDGEVTIRVKDNGLGIPKKLMEKIYQPFFTTKPTGEGTGLGLSLSYDIITKGHGGQLKVETAEGEYAEFIINLPLQAQKIS